MSEGTKAAVDTAAVAKDGPGQPADGVDADLVAQLVEQARAAGLQLTGDGGLLQQLTKRVLESAPDGEITDHLGYDKGAGGEERRELAQRCAGQDGADRCRPGGDRGAPRSGRQLRTADRAEAAAQVVRGGRHGDLPVRQGPHYRGDPGPPG